MSVRTMYSYLNQGLFTARDIDLKRKVRFKPRKCHKTQITNRTVFTNRLYRDFCNLKLSIQGASPWIHMELILYNSTQPVNGFPHIRSACYDIDFIGGCDIP